MKILHVSGFALRGGCEKNCFHFVKSTPQFEHQIIVLGPPGPMVDEWNSLGVQTLCLDTLQFNIYHFYKDFGRSLPEGNFEKVIVWTNMRMPVVLYCLNRYRASIYVHVGNPISKGALTTLKNCLLSMVLPVKNKVHLRPVSGYVRRSLQNDLYYRKFQNKVSMKPVTVPGMTIHSATSLSTTSPIILGMVARLENIKDHRTVLQAFALIKEDFTKARLHLIGDGSEKDALKKLARTLGIQRSVRFLGEVSEPAGYMRNWDLFLYATTLKEGLGGTIPEALAIGLPVVAVDLPMIREWDSTEKFITYCKPDNPVDMADKAKGLLGDPAKRRFIGDFAPEYISKAFDPADFSTNYLAE